LAPPGAGGARSSTQFLLIDRGETTADAERSKEKGEEDQARTREKEKEDRAAEQAAGPQARRRRTKAGEGEAG